MIQFVDEDIHGPDVSYYQDDNNTPQTINFETMKQKADFVIIRAGQNYWIDPDFKVNWRKAREAGLPRGAYWFYDSRAAPEPQAEIFASLFKDDRPEMELWLDLEENYNGKYLGYPNWKKFIERLKVLLPDIERGIYTGYGYIVGKIPWQQFDYFGDMPLWFAGYHKDNSIKPDLRFLNTPMPWKDNDIRFWQWGTPRVGPEYGAESLEIDMNIYNGNRTSFEFRYKLKHEDQNGDDNMSDVTLTADLKSGLTANVREIADAQGTLAGTITGPVTIKGVGNKINNDGYEWIHIIYPKVGYIALTSQFTNIQYTPPVVTVTRKVLKSTILFDDNTTLELFPNEADPNL